MKIYMISIMLFSVLAFDPVQGNIGGEKADIRTKRHSGPYGGRPTYGGYQNAASYQQPYYSNQRLQYPYGEQSTGYQQPINNYIQEYRNMRSFSYNQPGQNFFQPSPTSYQEYSSNTPDYYRLSNNQMTAWPSRNWS